MADSADVEAFTGITGASDAAAQRVLEICGGDLEQAVQLWFADEELQRSLSTPAGIAAAGGPTSSRNAHTTTRSNRPSRRPTGREDDAGVIHIDSDDSDDDDVDMTEDDAFDDEDEQAAAQSVARTAQEEEDAAMAKRLQEELYGGGGGGGGAGGLADDDVRAPMARTTETLVAPEGFPDQGSADAVLEGMRQRAMARQAHGRFRCWGWWGWFEWNANLDSGDSSRPRQPFCPVGLG